MAAFLTMADRNHVFARSGITIGEGGEHWLEDIARRESLPAVFSDGMVWAIVFHSFMMMQIGQKICIKEMRRMHRVPRATLSRHLKRLELDDWIMREASQSDRRKSYIIVTEKTVALIRKWLSVRSSMVEKKRLEAFCFIVE